MKSKNPSNDRWKKITDPKERDGSAFISPVGEWYNVPYGNHEAFAIDMGIAKGFEDVEDSVERSGWCYVHYGFYSEEATFVGRMNFKQYQVLKDFWKDRRVFMFGHSTIDELYYVFKRD